MFVAGAAIQWLRDGLGLLETRGRDRGDRALARRQRGRLLRPGARRARRAALGAGGARADRRPDARTRPRASRPRRARGDRVPDARRARRDGDSPLDVLRADGGAAANGFLMQLQADLARVPVEVAGGARRRRRWARPRSPASRSARGRTLAGRSGLAGAARYEPSLGAEEAAAAARGAGATPSAARCLESAAT